MINTFKGLINVKYHPIEFEDHKIKAYAKWHYLEKHDDDIWFVNNLFALRNDPLVLNFFKKKYPKRLKLDEKSYRTISMKHHPFANIKYEQNKNVYLNVKIEEDSNKYLVNSIEFKNDISQRSKPVKLLENLVIVNKDSEGLEAIPPSINSYIIRILKPTSAILKNDLCYFNDKNEIIAYLSPIKMYK